MATILDSIVNIQERSGTLYAYSMSTRIFSLINTRNFQMSSNVISKATTTNDLDLALAWLTISYYINHVF